MTVTERFPYKAKATMREKIITNEMSGAETLRMDVASSAQHVDISPSKLGSATSMKRTPDIA